MFLAQQPTQCPGANGAETIQIKPRLHQFYGGPQVRRYRLHNFSGCRPDTLLDLVDRRLLHLGQQRQTILAQASPLPCLSHSVAKSRHDLILPSIGEMAMASIDIWQMVA